MEPSPGSPQTIPCNQFLTCLSESGVMSAAEVKQVVANVAARPQTDARVVAQELVKQQRLTRYQATRLLRGNSRGLSLAGCVILEELGKGGMGIVYKARHRKLQRVIALKVLSPEVTGNQASLKRFQREARAVAQLRHPNIVAAHDAGEERGIYFLAMEFVEGRDLAEQVRQRGPLPADQAVDYVLQAARGLAYAHGQGIVHRDIKPSNLLLTEAPQAQGLQPQGLGLVKILDMGLARFDKAGNTQANETLTEELTKTGSIMGSCDYMAPEQALNAKTADHRADIYSLGCTLFFLLTGKTMYEGETVMEKVFAHQEKPIPALPGASAALQAAFRRMVAKDPTERFQTVAEAIAALEACAAPPTRKRSRRMWAAAALGTAALVALAVTMYSRHGHKNSAVTVQPTQPQILNLKWRPAGTIADEGRFDENGIVVRPGVEPYGPKEQPPKWPPTNRQGRPPDGLPNPGKPPAERPKDQPPKPPMGDTKPGDMRKEPDRKEPDPRRKERDAAIEEARRMTEEARKQLEKLLPEKRPEP